MNQCTFLGKVKQWDFYAFEGETERIVLVLDIENKRKMNGVKKIDYERLLFEAWGTAALTLHQNLRLDDYLLVINSTARKSEGGVCFRINEFKIMNRNN
jgi:hypothetical protein